MPKNLGIPIGIWLAIFSWTLSHAISQFAFESPHPHFKSDGPQGIGAHSSTHKHKTSPLRPARHSSQFRRLHHWQKCHARAVKHIHDNVLPMWGWHSLSARSQMQANGMASAPPASPFGTGRLGGRGTEGRVALGGGGSQLNIEGFKKLHLLTFSHLYNG